jgi:hypothetical protein
MFDTRPSLDVAQKDKNNTNYAKYAMLGKIITFSGFSLLYLYFSFKGSRRLDMQLNKC